MARKKKTKLEQFQADSEKRTAPKFTKGDRAELDRMTKQVRKWKHKSLMARSYGQRVALEFIKRFPRDTASWAEAIAAMCVAFDKDRDCRKLLIEWFHDHYAAYVVENALEEIESVMSLLKGLRYTRAEPVDEGNDYEAWLDSENVAILQDQNTRLAIVIEREPFYKLHVRRLRYQYDDLSKRKYWGYPSLQEMRRRKWKMKYGDSRDHGYVVSFGDLLAPQKVDHILSSWSLLEHFLFRVHTLNCVLHEYQTSRLSKLHADKDN